MSKQHTQYVCVTIFSTGSDQFQILLSYTLLLKATRSYALLPSVYALPTKHKCVHTLQCEYEIYCSLIHFITTAS